MSNFVVSARKYRPARFDEVVGQQHVSQTLKNALSNDHLAHAFLFCGPRGVGKTTCARILAKVLNCQNRTEDFEACNTCSSCTSFNENASFNVIELDAASNNSVDHIRALVEQVRFQPQQGSYKVYIIDEVHMLTASAFNAFLKTLEEPPSYAIFILATTEKHKIIPTILSRCQIFDFYRIQIPDIIAHLENICEQEGIKAEKDALHIVAQKADGALRDALSIFDRIVSFSGKEITYNQVIENLNVLDYEYYFQIVDALLSEDQAQVLLLFNDILKKGFEEGVFINGLAEHIRNLMVCKNPSTLELLQVGDSLKERYANQAQISSESFLMSALNLTNDCDVEYKLARNKRLHVEIALLKMCHLQRLIAAPLVATTEKKTPDVSEPVPPVLKKEKPAEKTQPEEKETTISETISQEEPLAKTIEPEPTVTNPLSASGGGMLFKSIANIEQEVVNEQAEEETVAELEMENVTQAWADFTKTVGSPSVRNFLNKAHLSLLAVDEIQIAAGTSMAIEAIRQESELMEFLRKALKFPLLKLKFELDASLLPKEPVQKPNKPMTDKDKYQKMVETNPKLSVFKDKMDLKPE